MTLAELNDILLAEDCSCVLFNHGRLTMCHKRGVSDLFALLTTSPEELKGAMIADKVVGKGAAALMACGKVSTVYAGVISTPALELLCDNSISVTYGQCVESIINRSGTGPCPVETLCKSCKTAAECVPLIENFISNLQPINK